MLESEALVGIYLKAEKCSPTLGGSTRNGICTFPMTDGKRS